MTPGRRSTSRVVGPTHPYKGGVAAHTTELAHRLAAAGHDSTWSRGPGCTRRRSTPASSRAGRRARPAAVTRAPAGRCAGPVPDTWVADRAPAARPSTWSSSCTSSRRSCRHLALLRAAGVGRRAAPAAARGRRDRPQRAAARAAPRRQAADAAAARAASTPSSCTPRSRPRWPRGSAPPDVRGRRPAAAPARRRPRCPARRPRRPAAAARRSASCATTRASTCCWRRCARCRARAHRRRRAVGRRRASGPRAGRRPAAARAGSTVLAGYVPADRLAGPAGRTHDVLALPYRHATASQNALLGHAPRPAGAGQPRSARSRSRSGTASTGCSCRRATSTRSSRRCAGWPARRRWTGCAAGRPAARTWTRPWHPYLAALLGEGAA